MPRSPVTSVLKSRRRKNEQVIAADILSQVPERSRVAIVRLRSLGDCVLTTPAIQILKASRPDLSLGIVVEQRFAAIFEGNRAVDRVLEPGWAALRRWRPFLCLNFHGGTRSMGLVAASGARIRAGFAHHKGAWIYNARIPRAQEILGEERTVHTAEHLASAMFWLGCPRQEIPRASLPIEAQAENGDYAVIHAAAAAAYKTWPSEGFLAAARHLKERWHLEPVFIGGDRDDFQAFSAYRVVAGAPLREVMRLIAGARIFLGNDSGPAHIAAAAGVPLVVLYGRPEHGVIWAPWKAEHSRSLVSPEGIASISAKAVLEALDDLLSRS